MDPLQKSLVKGLLVEVLGIDLVPFEKEQVVITPEIQQLIDQREKVRLEKDWAAADVLRDQLKQLGYDVQDKKA